jgi:hypothetical protein
MLLKYVIFLISYSFGAVSMNEALSSRASTKRTKLGNMRHFISGKRKDK